MIPAGMPALVVLIPTDRHQSRRLLVVVVVPPPRFRLRSPWFGMDG